MMKASCSEFKDGYDLCERLVCANISDVSSA